MNVLPEDAPLLRRLGRGSLPWESVPIPAPAAFVELVQIERQRQDKKWGIQEGHSLDRWGNILTEELGSFIKQVNELESGRVTNLARVVEELTHTAAVAQSIYEQYLYPRLLQETSE